MNRIQLLRLFNPTIRIFGLFGGDEKYYQNIKKSLGNELEHIYCIPGKSAKWNWRNGDLALKLWYRDYGKDLLFDMLHIIEWDLLVLNSISQVYKCIPENGVGLSGLTLLKNMDKEWYWTTKEPYKTEWEKLLAFVKDKYNYNMELYACIAGGACFPKAFIEKYSATDIPELCNDEARLPLFAQIFGFKLYDTGIYNRFNVDEFKYFNLKQQINTQIILKEISTVEGKRVFHPYYKVFCKLAVCNHWYNVWHSIVYFAEHKIIEPIKLILIKLLGHRLYKAIKEKLKKSRLKN